MCDIKIRRLEWAGTFVIMEEERIQMERYLCEIPQRKISRKTKKKMGQNLVQRDAFNRSEESTWE